MSKNEATLLLRIKQAGGEILDHFVFTIKDVIDVVSELPKFLMECVEKFQEQDKAVNELTQAMMQNGTFTGALRDKYLELSEAMQQKTTFDNDAIISAEATLQSMIGNKVVTEDLLKATLDLAAAKKMDLNSAAQLVGKAINNETDILKRQGIEVKDVTDANTRMGHVIEGIEDKFKGQAAAQAQGLGILTQLKHSWEDFMKSVGGLMAPFVIALAQGAKGALDFFTALMPKSVDYTKQSLNQLALSIINIRKELIETQEKLANPAQANDGFLLSLQQSLEKRLAAAHDAREQMLAAEAEAAERSKQIEIDKHAQFTELEQQRIIKKQDMIMQEASMDGMAATEKSAAKVRQIDAEIAITQSGVQKKALILQRAGLVEAAAEQLRAKQKLEIESTLQTQRADIITASADLVVAIGGSESKAAFLIQKAAALATTWMLTQVGAAQALASIPYPANLAAAANIETIGYIKMGTIAATAIKGLATGGIVSARQGGTPFILGEGGRDEAVVPLDDPDAKARLGGGGSMTVVFQGPMLGNEEQADQFARVLDRAFLRLRQSNQSLAFETDLF